VIARLQQIRITASDIEATAKELSSLYEISLVPFDPHFQQLIQNYSTEYEKYRLDEIVVAAIAPVVRRMVATWNPLEDPTFLLPTFKNWRRALKINSEVLKPDKQIDMYGTTTNMVKLVDPYVDLPVRRLISLLYV
jgi:tuftelin-interacting protein 11